MDVSLNNIGAYGIDTLQGTFGSAKIPATSTAWSGFIIALASFFTIAIRSLYKRQAHLKSADACFGALGVIGLMITLSGGILLFWHNNALIIPFFSYQLTRITYYHIGIALDCLSLFYFALTK